MRGGQLGYCCNYYYLSLHFSGSWTGTANDVSSMVLLALCRVSGTLGNWFLLPLLWGGVWEGRRKEGGAEAKLHGGTPPPPLPSHPAGPCCVHPALYIVVFTLWVLGALFGLSVNNLLATLLDSSQTL